MSYYLFLDDSREPGKVTWVDLPQCVDWVIAKSYLDFVQIIQKRGIPKFVTYDCDLCDEHYKAYFDLRFRYVLHYKNFDTKCGIECAEFLLNQCDKLKIKHPDCAIHTKNEYAAGFIKNLINRHNRRYS